MKYKDEALKLAHLSVCIGPAEQKKILVPKWSSLKPEEFHKINYEHYWHNATGLGLICGANSNIICVDIDLDINTDKELIDKITRQLPPIFSGKIGNPNRPPARFFKFNGEKAQKFNNIHCEILSTGNQTIIPPSKHPKFNKNYEWTGRPLPNLSDIDELPDLPKGFIEFLTDLNTTHNESTSASPNNTVTPATGNRCNHGSHNKLSSIAVALFHDNYPFDRLVKRMLDEDKKINHAAPSLYFNCPSRPWKHKSIEENAKDFIEEIFKNYGPGGRKTDQSLTQNRTRIEEGFGSFVSDPLTKKEDKNAIELLTLHDLLERPDEKTQYLVENLLPTGGTSIVAAKPKCGKTTLLRQLSLCVARGEMFLNRVCSKGPVIYFSVEEKIDEIKSHFKDMGADGTEEIYIFANRAPKDTLDKLKPIIDKIKPSLLILDTLFKIIRMKDANDYAAISTALEPIQDLARQTGTHVLCVHHAGKSERDGADGILGSTAILGAFDTAIIMNRQNDKRTIKSIQRYGSDMDDSVLLFDTISRRSMLGQESWRAKSDERIATILEYLRQADQKVTMPDIKQGTGMDKDLMYKTVKYMVENNLLHTSGKGVKGDPLMYSISIL